MLNSITIAISAILALGGIIPAEQAGLSSSSVESAQADDSIQRIADQLSGTWVTKSPFQTIENEDGSTTDQFMTMSIAQVEIPGMENTMYTESALTDTPWSPFRHAIFQLYTYKGKVRLRTYTIAMQADSMKLLTGMTGAPHHFTGVTRDQLIATLDVELESTGAGFTGSTPYPYPTGVGGAVEMTSSVNFDGTTLTTADRGYDAEGEVVWGAGEDSSYQFVKTEPYIVVSEREDGLVVMDYPSSQSDMVVQDRDEMSVHYYGFLTDGTVFDTSYSRGVPYSFVYPPGNRAIVGWGEGMVGLTDGAHRKLIIPGDLGYGSSGNPRAKIPGDSTLIFNVYLAELKRPDPADESGTTEPAGSAIKGSVRPGHEGHDHD